MKKPILTTPVLVFTTITATFLTLGTATAGCSQEQSGEQDTQLVDSEPVEAAEQELQERRPPADPDLKFADLGSCRVESGETIRDCRIAYRTFGTLNASKDNAVLWPTWFTGRTSDLVALGVPTKFVDTSRYYLILVDALGDGVSISPSNSRSQGRLRFPKFNVRDMVETEHRMLTEKLGIQHLRAVAGISMGGMQAMQWSVSYPTFMDKIVSAVGTPQLTSQDLLLWHSMVSSLDENVLYRRGNYHGHPQIKTTADILQLVLFTPEYRVANTSREQFDDFLAAGEQTTFDWNDEHRQLEAMIGHDVGAPYGSLEAAAARVQAKSLYMNSAKDLVVNPLPAQQFAPLVNATIEVTDSNCGHLAVQVCDTDASAARIRSYISEN